MTPRLTLIAAGLAATLAAPVAHACKPAEAVAFVARIEGRDTRGELQSGGGAAVRLAPFTSLCSGDIVRTYGTSGAITIRERNGTSVRIPLNTTYTVDAQSKRRTIVANVFDIVFDTVLPDLPRWSSAAVSRSLNGEMDLAGIGAPLPVQVIAETSVKSGLLVRWANGVPPFGITIADAAGKQVASRQLDSGQEVQLGGALKAGAYSLLVEDARKKSVRGDFRVVAGDVVYPAEAQVSAEVDPGLRQVAMALLLAKQDGGATRFQALQLLRDGDVAGLDRDGIVAYIDRQ